MISLRLFAGEKFRGERTRSSRRSFVRGIPASLPQSFISERMEEERDSRSVLQCKRHLWVSSSSRYTKVSGRSSPLPALRSNCDHFALRNPPLIGSNYPPTGSRSLRTKAKPTIRLVRKKEKKRRRIVPFETKGELKIEGKEIGGGGRKRRGPRVGKTMKSLSSLPPPVDGENEDCRIARKASFRSARKNRGTLTRDWEVQPIV